MQLRERAVDTRRRGIAILHHEKPRIPQSSCSQKLRAIVERQKAKRAAATASLLSLETYRFRVIQPGDKTTNWYRSTQTQRPTVSLVTTFHASDKILKGETT